MNASNPLVDSNGSSEGTAIDFKEEYLFLTNDQMELIEKFREDVRRCSDRKKLELCAEMRSLLLREHMKLESTIALVERVMSVECPEYVRCKAKRVYKTKDETEEWERFIGIATTGSEAIEKFLSHLKAVSLSWGQEKVQHYCWSKRGWKFCKILGSLAHKMTWSEFVVKANQLLLRRQQKCGAREIKDSSDPLDPIELHSIKDWSGLGPFIIKNDPSRNKIFYKELSLIDLPLGFGFDQYNLIVRKQYAIFFPESQAGPAQVEVSDVAETQISLPSKEAGDMTESSMSALGSERSPIDIDMNTAQPAAEISPVDASPTLSHTGGSGWTSVNQSSSVSEFEDSLNSNTDLGINIITDCLDHTENSPIDSDSDLSKKDVTQNQHFTAQKSMCRTGGPVPDESGSDADNHQLTTDDSRGRRRSLRLRGTNSEDSTTESGSASGIDKLPHSADHTTRTVEIRITRNLDVNYTETPSRKGKSRPVRPTVNPLSLKGPSQSRCCPTEVPSDLLDILDKDLFQALTSRSYANLIRPYNDHLPQLCPLHLQRANRAMSESLFKMDFKEPIQNPFFGEHNNRKRRASLSDIASNLKKPCLDELAFLSHNSLAATPQGSRPLQDRSCDEGYRERVLVELKTKLKDNMRPKSHGAKADKLVYEILCKSSTPTTDESGNPEAHFLTGAEAAVRVELGSTDVPIVTQGQQQFRWAKGCPIAQLFRRMENLDRDVEVQIPSIDSNKNSFQSRSLRVVQKRFLEGRPTNDPWNLLDVGSPLPHSVLPSFLGGENCQLLPRVRDAVLMGTRAERAVISSDEWKEWRDILEWVLISEGGNNTVPHTDSHGLSTWITVQKGQVGFGWMSRPTPEERRQWISNPDSYTGGRWRYIVLPPGWTVFFTSGTIHFVFRIQAEQTLGLGGHILQWTSIRKWLEVVADQVRNPQMTNENMEETVKVYIYHILDLMSRRVKNGRIEEIGGQDEVKRVLALVKDIEKEIPNLFLPADVDQEIVRLSNRGLSYL